MLIPCVPFVCRKSASPIIALEFAVTYNPSPVPWLPDLVVAETSSTLAGAVVPMPTSPVNVGLSDGALQLSQLVTKVASAGLPFAIGVLLGQIVCVDAGRLKKPAPHNMIGMRNHRFATMRISNRLTWNALIRSERELLVHVFRTYRVKNFKIRRSEVLSIYLG